MVCCATARSRDFGDVREVLCGGKSVGYGSCEGGRLMVEEVGRDGVLGFFLRLGDILGWTVGIEMFRV